MLTATLFLLFAVAAMIAVAVLADASLRGRTALRALRGERAKIAAQPNGRRAVVLSVWTKEHAPSRIITAEYERQLAAA